MYHRWCAGGGVRSSSSVFVMRITRPMIRLRNRDDRIACSRLSIASFRSKPPAASAAPKSIVTIEFEKKTAKFRIPSPSYNFSDLLKDATSYFRTENKEFVLTDSEHLIWPSSGNVVDLMKQETELSVKLVRKPETANSSARSAETSTVEDDDDLLEGFPATSSSGSIPKRVRRTKDLQILFSSLDDLISSAWFRDRMRERGLDSDSRDVSGQIYHTLAGEFLTELLENAESVEMITNSTLPRMEMERKLVDSFEEYARQHRPSAFSDALELQPKEKEQSSAASGRTKTVKKQKPLLRLTDLRKPHLWYSSAREMKRKIYLHIGPTNSGKTHTALEALKRSSSGVYCGPLRLLAHEIYDRLNRSGVKCNLVTGQVVKKEEDAKHVSCTIEMADLSIVYDCAVIDEYQLLGDASRGWAWTRALLGLQAHEIHLCGNEACEDLVRRLVEQCGDTLHVERYERLAPLRVVNPVTRVGSLRPGDCLIAFSRKNIYALKGIIEDNRKEFKCSVVYGSLPPETRTQQARLFNHLSEEYPVLVASDAVGMGLNLNIRRVIFSSLKKFDGTQMRELTVSEVKQIAGRAGRFKSIYPEGEVTCMEPKDMRQLREAMTSPVDPVMSAGLLPSAEQLEMFASVFSAPDGKKETPFSELLSRFLEMCRVEKDYFVCESKDMLAIAGQVDHLPLSIADRYLFCIAPLNVDEPRCMSSLVRWAVAHSNGAEVVLHWKLPSVETITPKTAEKLLQELEISHNIISSYLWLSMRCSTFTAHEPAQRLRRDCEQMIERCLMMINRETPKKYFKKILQTQAEEEKRHESVVDVDEDSRSGVLVEVDGQKRTK